MSALKNAASGAAAGSAAGPWGAAIGGALGLGSSLISGLFGKSSQDKANKMNLRIMREQNEFNAKEAEKQRAWTKQMQDMYGTASAQADNMRAAGLNSLLSGVQQQNIGSGATASAAENAQMQAYDYAPFQRMGSSVMDAVSTYNDSRSVDSQISLNKTVETLNQANADLTKANEDLSKEQSRYTQQRVEEMKLNVDYLTKTFGSRVRSQYLQEQINDWTGTNIKYQALNQMYDLFSVKPQIVQNYQANCVLSYAQAFKAIAEGKLTYKEVQNYAKNLAIRGTMAMGTYMSGQGALLSGKGAFMRDKATALNIGEDTKQKQFYNDFWLGNQSDDDALKYIKRTPRINKLYQINLGTANQTLENLKLQPNLIKSLGEMYDSQTFSNYNGAANDWLNTFGNWSSGSEQTTTTERYGKDGDFRGASKKTTNSQNTKASGFNKRVKQFRMRFKAASKTIKI